MAYSDYGGLAFRNGERVDERSDCCFSAEGLKSSHGIWPGFVFEEGRAGNSYHVVLGDGPIFVAMYKQSSIAIHRGSEVVDILPFLLSEKMKVTYGEGAEATTYLNSDYFKETEEPLVIEIDGHKLTVYFLISDNHYQYAKLEQPDGVIWTGFSGYGVGAGLEDGGYGYSTPDQIDKLRCLFA